MEIKDSGERRQFNSGAVRDMAEGKGRFDLMPLSTMTRLARVTDEDKRVSEFLLHMFKFTRTINVDELYYALTVYMDIAYKSSNFAMLELAKHFEEGCKKYGDRNWQMGVPIRCYIDSTLRHFFKYRDGWKDEPHDRAAMWNIMCCIWTVENKPELVKEYEVERE